MKARLPLAACLRLLLLACGSAAACGSPSGPTPDPGPPQIACASPLTADGAVGAGRTVTYPAPVTANGTAPVTVTCTPASGAMFPLGETVVTCTARDSVTRSASCSFPVTVTHRPIAATTFVAFGDSITEGQNGRPLNFIPVVDEANAYPTILQQYFMARIPSQPIVVINQGRGGESITDNDARLKLVIASYQPQVLLFLEGANDMLAGTSAPTIANAVRDSIRTARERGVQYVFVSTLLPVAPANCQPFPAPRCRGAEVPPGLPSAVNDLVRPLVPANGAYLVDPYAEFVANSATYVDLDGLHLRPEGNRALATAFWNRIVAVLPPRLLSGWTGYARN